ncbi:helix-turn-helix transcriptional regulator [Streptomyces sp. V4-01]|uniref:Helix-turn-helix transcriptional regulator n=1 Tax=Actinacidiphila polyblastidii TaxID=3110430 RepID=A0ABU7PKV4_9ACTN|nr:helix-turn-helix transcriptional regulator [Streptomyces sp. V4-01]
MPPTIRLSKPMIAVLQVLLTVTSDHPAWGLSICMDADLGSGTVYPVLDRLIERGWVTRRSETTPHPGRPARQYYELTGTGRAHAQAQAAPRARAERRSPFFARRPVEGT